MAGAIDVLLVRIEADLSDLKKELDKGAAAVDGAAKKMVNSTKQAETGFLSLGRALSGVFTIAAISMIARAGKAALDAGGDIKDMADAIGVTTDSFQELTFAGAQFGVSQENISASLAIFSRNVGQAADGNGQLIKTFRDLGVTILDANGKLKSNDTVLNDVVEAISRIPDPARQTAVGFELFGRSFARLLPMFRDGKVGLDALRQSAHDYNAVMGKEAIDASDAASDKIKELEKSFATLAQTLMAKVAPSIKWVIDQWQDMLFKATPLVEEIAKLNKELAGLAGDKSPYSNIMRPRLEAKRDELQQQLLIQKYGTPFAPKGGMEAPSIGGGGSNPTSDAANKMMAQIQLQLRLAGVTGATTEEIERQRLAIEARAKAIEGGLVGEQIKQYEQAALKVFDLTEAEKARFDGIKAGNEHLQENIDKELKIIEFKEKLLATTEREVEDNDRLIAALQKGTKEYERELAIIQLINRAKDAKADLTEEEIENYKKLADTLGDQRDQLDKIKDQIDDNKRASRDFAHVIGTAFEDAIVGGKGLRDVMKGLEQDIARIILRMTITKPLQDMLTGGGSSGGGGGLLGSLGGLLGPGLGSIFGGGDTSAPVGNFLAGGNGNPGSMDYAGYASGGNPPVGKASMVGERGPELFVPKTPGTIISNDNLKRMGGPTVYIDARNADGPGMQRVETAIREMNGTLERRAVSAVLEHKRRNPAAFA